MNSVWMKAKSHGVWGKGHQSGLQGLHQQTLLVETSTLTCPALRFQSLFIHMMIYAFIYVCLFIYSYGSWQNGRLFYSLLCRGWSGFVRPISVVMEKWRKSLIGKTCAFSPNRVCANFLMLHFDCGFVWKQGYRRSTQTHRSTDFYHFRHTHILLEMSTLCWSLLSSTCLGVLYTRLNMKVLQMDL